METYHPSELRSLFAGNSNVRISWLALVTFISLPFILVFGLVVVPEGEARTWFDDGMLFGGACFAALATLTAALRYRGTRTGAAWGLIFLGLTFMAFGEGAWGYQELILHKDVESPSIADIGYIAFYVPVFCGLLAMPQAPITGLSRIRLTLDIAVAIGAISLISGHLLISALISDSALGAGDVIGIAYPILDLALVFAALVVAARSGFNLTSASLVLLALGFAFIAGSDSVFTYLTSVGDYYSGNFIDTGWMIGYSLIAWAGFLAAGRQLNLDAYKDADARPASPIQTVLLYSVMIPVIAVLFVNAGGKEVRVNLAVMIGFLALTSVIMLRQAITYVEHSYMYAQLERHNNALAERLRVAKIQSILQTDDRFEVRGERESAKPDRA